MSNRIDKQLQMIHHENDLLGVDASEKDKIAYYIEQNKKYRFSFHCPAALTWWGWEAWKRELKKECPIRYFFKYGPIHTARIRVQARLSRLRWNILHRVVPKHQYHIIRPRTLTPGFHDHDERILHACMGEIRQFVDNSGPIVSWDDHDPGNLLILHEMLDICDWWVRVYPTREQEWERAFEEQHGAERGADYFDALFEQEKKWKDEEDQMLSRLIKIRRYLWS
jgi:hypothetical protein